MIPLPSGQIVGISNIRARYHALRLNRYIDNSTAHHELYDLVDIVANPVETEDLPYHYHPRIRFTGHTLSELSNIRSWSVDDRHTFKEWLSQDNQVQLIEQTRHRIFSEELPLIEQHFNHPDNLYSLLKRRLEALPMGRASIAQWRNTLLNMKKQGIREEEIKWSGLLAYLSKCEEQQRTSATRRELLAAINFSAIRLSLTNELATEKSNKLDFFEVPQSRIHNSFHSEQKIAQADEICVIRYVELMHYYKVGFIKKLKLNRNESIKDQWFVLDTIGNPVNNSVSNRPRFQSKLEAFEAASRHALQHVGVPVEYSPCQRYEHKTLCGGEDYREWLVTLPDYPISHFTSHYNARNVLLHFRTKKRTDTQGRKLLFIEEIQSDWHQSGAMHGYQNRWPGSIPPAPFRKEWIGLSLKLLLQEAATSEVDGIAWTSSDIQESHYSKQMKPIMRLYDEEIPRYLERLCRPWGGVIETCQISTKEPRLHISREMNKWFVTDTRGEFSTRPRYSQQEAIRVMARHCKQVVLDVPVIFLDQTMKRQIKNKGLPIFGEQSDH
ncbi:MAG: hypothetical protein ABW115_04865 [Candidatus Thiodiazotropha sp. 6PLUC6]